MFGNALLFMLDKEHLQPKFVVPPLGPSPFEETGSQGPSGQTASPRSARTAPSNIPAPSPLVFPDPLQNRARPSTPMNTPSSPVKTSASRSCSPVKRAGSRAASPVKPGLIVHSPPTRATTAPVTPQKPRTRLPTSPFMQGGRSSPTRVLADRSTSFLDGSSGEHAFC